MMSKLNSQTNRVLHYLNEHTFITRRIAFDDLGIANLTAVISVIRDKGYAVKTTMVCAKNRYGEHVKYAQYRLASKE